jgi:hypothetical protein
MIVTTNQEPIFFYISKGSTHDVTVAYDFLPYMPKNSIVIGDKGYVSNKLDNFFTKLKLFIFSYSFDCFLKLNDKQQNLLFN